MCRPHLLAASGGNRWCGWAASAAVEGPAVAGAYYPHPLSQWKIIMSSLKSWLSDRFNLILWMCICEHFASSLQIWHLSCSIPILGNCMGCNWWEFESTCNFLQQNWYFGPLCNAFVRKDALVVLPWCYNSFWRASPTIQHIWLIMSYSEQLGPQKKANQTDKCTPASFLKVSRVKPECVYKILIGFGPPIPKISRLLGCIAKSLSIWAKCAILMP